MQEWFALVGTIVGAAVAVLVQFLAAKREDRRERIRWEREDERQWLHQRREIYYSTGGVALRWIWSFRDRTDELEGLRDQFRSQMLAIELLAPVEVRNAAHEVLSVLGDLSEESAKEAGLTGGVPERAIIVVAFMIHLMRVVLGVPDEMPLTI